MMTPGPQHSQIATMNNNWTGWTPILRVQDGERSSEFYCKVLGFQQDWIHRFADDFPAYISVSRDPLILHLSEHGEGGIEKAVLFVHVPDVDAVYEEFRANGLAADPPVSEPEIGLRQFEFQDPDGHELSFGTGIGSNAE